MELVTWDKRGLNKRKMGDVRLPGLVPGSREGGLGYFLEDILSLSGGLRGPSKRHILRFSFRRLSFGFYGHVEQFCMCTV